MPNWCVGNIRFRGKKADIKRLLLDVIVQCKHEKTDNECKTIESKATVKDDGYMLTFMKESKSSWFYFKGTRRYFPEDDIIEVWIEEDDPDKEIIVCIDNVKAAWSFEHCEAWQEYAKEYQIDVKLTGYERGMMFSQIKTIMRNGKTKDETKEYSTWEEWMWDCPLPNNGG